MTTKLILKEPGKLKTVFQAMQSVMEEVNVRIDQHGLNLRGMSSSRVTLSDILIPKEAFEEFPAVDKEITFRINLDPIIKILGRSNKGDSLDMELTERTLNLIINSKYKKTFEMSLTAFDQQEDRLPKVTFKNEIEAGSDILHEILGDIKLVTEYIELDIHNNELKVNGEGRDQNAGATLDFYGEDAKIMTVVRNEEPAKKSFNIKNFDSVVSTLKGLVDNVILEFDNSMPLRLAFDIEGLGKLHHFITPMIRD